MIHTLRQRLAEAQLALMLLTRLPAGRLPDPAPPVAAGAWAFPLAGLAVGALGAGVLTGALALGVPATLAAGLALGAQIMATGALHEDGLADVADGLWGGHDRARRLEIMRDSRIGSYGTLALVLGVGLRWAALAHLAQDAALTAAAALVGVAMLSRLGPVALLATLPPARGDGLGRSAAGPGRGVWVAGALALPALLVPGILPGVLTAAAAVGWLGRTARARLGGQTGDVLGAAQQLAEITLLIALATALA